MYIWLAVASVLPMLLAAPKCDSKTGLLKPLPECGAEVPAHCCQDVLLTIDVEHTRRQYCYHTPEQHGNQLVPPAPVPLLVFLHQEGQSTADVYVTTVTIVKRSILHIPQPLSGTFIV